MCSTSLLLKWSWFLVNCVTSLCLPVFIPSSNQIKSWVTNNPRKLWYHGKQKSSYVERVFPNCPCVPRSMCTILFIGMETPIVLPGNESRIRCKPCRRLLLGVLPNLGEGRAGKLIFSLGVSLSYQFQHQKWLTCTGVKLEQFFGTTYVSTGKYTKGLHCRVMTVKCTIPGAHWPKRWG